MLAIQRMTTTQRHHQQSGKYRELIGITEQVVESARRVVEKTSKTRGQDMFADVAIGEIRKEIEHFCGLGSRVIDQARRRVLDGEQVATSEKIYSIFEPHTARSEEHTSELQSPDHLVCRLLLEKKKNVNPCHVEIKCPFIILPSLTLPWAATH